MTHQIAPALADRAVPIDDLHPHPLNARRRDRRAEAELRQSLQTHGQYRAVVARRLEDGTLQLLAGHGTTEQARQLGWDQIAAEVHDGMDDGTAAKIVAVDNRTSDLAGYDPQAEAELLAEIKRICDGDLTGTGYLEEEYLDVLDRAAADVTGGGGLTDPDAVPDPPGPAPTTETGQTWLLGPHRLTVGDGTDPAVVARAVGEEIADLLITDPPYGVDYVGKTSQALTIQNDGSGGGLRALLDDLFAASYEHVKPGGPAYVFHADTERVNFQQAFEGAGWLFKQNLQWVKDRFVLGRQDHHWQHEPILYGWRPGAAHRWYGGRTLTTLLDDDREPRDYTKDEAVAVLEAIREESSTVLRAKRPAASREHPTMKPVALLVRLLERSSRHHELVLDTCAGSGAIMIAAHQLGRRAAMVELDPVYGDVICRRWEEHTGQTPVLEETGQAHTFVPADAEAS